MKQAEVLFVGQPWLLTPESHAAMVTASRSFFDTTTKIEPEPDSDSLTVENGVGIITISGPIIRSPGILSQILFGATDTESIIEAVNRAAANSQVQAVLLDIDSPSARWHSINWSFFCASSSSADARARA